MNNPKATRNFFKKQSSSPPPTERDPLITNNTKNKKKKGEERQQLLQQHQQEQQQHQQVRRRHRSSDFSEDNTTSVSSNNHHMVRGFDNYTTTNSSSENNAYSSSYLPPSTTATAGDDSVGNNGHLDNNGYSQRQPTTTTNFTTRDPMTQQQQIIEHTNSNVNFNRSRDYGSEDYRHDYFSSNREDSVSHISNIDSRSRNNDDHNNNDRSAHLLHDAASDTRTTVSEDIFTVRKSALTVMEPLTNTWLIFTIGVTLSIVLLCSRWTELYYFSYWFIFFPSWISHAGLFGCHALSARHLSSFIASANENRQRQDSTDHIDRTEYLPLLQRALKFGLKTGILCTLIFIFEVLIYIHLTKGVADGNGGGGDDGSSSGISFGSAFTPIWILVITGILEGIVCDNQHIIRVFCWLCLCFSMMMSTIKFGDSEEAKDVEWETILYPIILILCICTVFLIYLVCGHQIGYFRMTESQLTAGVLYTCSSVLSIVLMILSLQHEEQQQNGQQQQQNDVYDIKIFMTILCPLSFLLTGMGAWAVSRDEYHRLLQYGGQATVYPMKLRFEDDGWTCVESKGVMIIPFFGEVAYEPLSKSSSHENSSGTILEMCCSNSCCSCYPYEEDDTTATEYENRTMSVYPGLTINRSASHSFRRGVSHTQSTHESIV